LRLRVERATVGSVKRFLRFGHGVVTGDAAAGASPGSRWDWFACSRVGCTRIGSVGVMRAAGRIPSDIFTHLMRIIGKEANRLHL
jgi:hypothetical protein